MIKSAFFVFSNLLAICYGYDSFELTDFCVRLTTNNTALVRWFDPMPKRMEKRGYTLYYTKHLDYLLDEWSSVDLGLYPMTTITDISLEDVYHFKVRINLWESDKPGPLSEVQHFKMLNRTRSCYDDSKRAVSVLRAAAISRSSVEVWWTLQYDPYQVKGFTIFYGKSDLGRWYNVSVGLQNSIQLTNLDENNTYKITIAAITNSGLKYYTQECLATVTPEEVPMNPKVIDITSNSMVVQWSPPLRLLPKYYKISYNAVKEYIDSDGITQYYESDKTEQFIGHHLTTLELVDLTAYTTYFINISAIPFDYSYRPSIQVSARTEVGAPPKLQKPTINGIVHEDGIQVLLPKASEENGPVSYYYLIVIPVSGDTEIHVPSSMYTTEDLLDNQWFDDEEIDSPYIAAKFSSNIPYAFILGAGVYDGFKNHKLDVQKRYRLFVRAVVVTSQGHLFTDSPYSDYFSVEEKKSQLRQNVNYVGGR